MAVLATKLSAASTSSRGRSRNTSTIGRLLRACSLCNAANTGLSASDSRTTSPTTTSTMLNRNGSRQPQAANCSGVVAAVTAMNSSCARINPAGTPTCENDP